MKPKRAIDYIAEYAKTSSESEENIRAILYEYWQDIKRELESMGSVKVKIESLGYIVSRYKRMSKEYKENTTGGSTAMDRGTKIKVKRLIGIWEQEYAANAEVVKAQIEYMATGKKAPYEKRHNTFKAGRKAPARVEKGKDSMDQQGTDS